MICDIGNFLVLLGFLLLPLQMASSFSNEFLLSRIKILHFIAILSAYGLLVFGFLTHDTSILGVLLYSCPDHPFYYKIGSTWSYHQGSMLLWVFLMSLVALKIPHRALKIFSFFQIYFLSLLFFKASPFIEVPSGNFLSRGINPLLEDSALLYHPPILYMGYILIFASWSIILSFLLRKRDISLLKAQDIKSWVIGAYIALTLGLTSGSFWAFYEVGWGGWWFWDPVENIAFIPWLLLLGAIHLLRDKTPSFHLKFLIFLSFSFTFLGVFIVRMGIIRSIHNFTQTLDNLIFVKVGICFIFASIIFLLRNSFSNIQNNPKLLNLPKLSNSQSLSKNSLGILGIMLSLLIGIATFFPLVASFEISQNFYTQIITPLCCLYPLILIFALSPGTLKITTIVIVFGLIILNSLEKHELIPFFTVVIIAVSLGVSLWNTPWQKNSSIAHTGLLIFLLGASFNHFLKYEKEIILKINDSTFFMGEQIKLQEIKIIQTPTYKSELAKISWRDISFSPERRYYKNYDIIRPKVVFSLGIFDTYYIYIENRIDDGVDQKWQFKIQYHPLISWIWLGGILMAIGSVLYLTKRYKK